MSLDTIIQEHTTPWSADDVSCYDAEGNDLFVACNFNETMVEAVNLVVKLRAQIVNLEEWNKNKELEIQRYRNMPHNDHEQHRLTLAAAALTGYRSVGNAGASESLLIAQWCQKDADAVLEQLMKTKGTPSA